MEEARIDRDHIVRLCRDFCIDKGYSGDSFLECVEECITRERERK
ncbi:MAG: hypothetical protein RMH77_05205 [Sulfolobales archaeon]|nr:hypothetical protein [Sulfolobales archaeon]MDW7969782.1 hypothetical protein [Sulfolobales archaeon]